MPFFVLFILIPISELMVFVSVSDEIGLGTALLISLLTAIIGGAIVKYQGIQTMSAANQSLQKGHVPSKEMFDGFCLIAAGATLITPGFITDALGCALLIPAFRNLLRNKMVQSGKFQATGFSAEYGEFHDGNPHARPADPTIIEAEYETLDDDNNTKNNG